MKKLLLLMLLAVPAYGQIDLDPFGPETWKSKIKLLTRISNDAGDTTAMYIYAPNSTELDLVGANIFQISNGTLTIFKNPGHIAFEQADGVLYLTTPANIEGTATVTIPFDSGRVDVHNVTSLGSDAFAGYATTDTVSVPGALSTDLYSLTPGVSIDGPATEPLSGQAFDGYFIVYRASGNEADLPYTWRRFRQ
jgi:hypothetical protein